MRSCRRSPRPRTHTVLAIMLLAVATSLANVTFTDVTSVFELGDTGKQSGAFIDYNDDGWTDLQMDTGLYRNEGGTKFVKAGPGGQQMAWGDIDNDGYLDFFTATNGDIHYGSKDGTFSDDVLEGRPHGCSDACTMLDVDGDGLLDIYWSGYETGIGAPQPDALYKNLGDRTFKLIWTQQKHYPARGNIAADFDNDGDTDLYISNYRLRGNLLWRNTGDGTLVFASASHGVLGGRGHSIGSAFGDIDNDGLIDIFAGNFAHGGQPQSRFFRNRGAEHDYTFEDKGTCGVYYQESYASPTLGDYDNDGDLDLFFTTVYGHNQAGMFSNAGDWNFRNVTRESGVNGISFTYQAAWGDFDNDGDLDLVTGGHLYQNDGNPNNWLKVKLIGIGNVNRSAIGAVVRVKLGDKTLTRQVESSTGRSNVNDLTLHFGLGTHQGDVNLEIAWPYAERQVVTTSVNRTVTVKRGEDD